MLSGLRLVIGGVCAALIAVLTGLGVSATMRSYVAPAAALPARGALIEPADHPEWKQFLVRAALRRADELNRLRDLPGGLSGNNGDGASTASLPGGANDSAPDDETGSIAQTPSVMIPIDIGETSSTELPVARPKEPAQAQPAQAQPARAQAERVKSEVARPAKSVRKPRARRSKPAATPAAATNPFNQLFGDSRAN